MPVGNVPSTGSALTGSRSPSPAISIVVTCLTKSGASSGTVTSIERSLVACRGNLDTMEVGEGEVDGGEVPLDDGSTPAGVGRLDRRLDLLDGDLRREDTGELEEARLHDRVDAVAHLRLAGDLVCVDDPQRDLLVEDLSLHLDRQVVPHLVGAEAAS